MSDLDELADAIGFDLPAPCATKGPRSAKRMRNIRKQYGRSGSGPRGRQASYFSNKHKPAPITLPKLKCLQEDE